MKLIARKRIESKRKSKTKSKRKSKRKEKKKTSFWRVKEAVRVGSRNFRRKKWILKKFLRRESKDHKEGICPKAF